MKRMRRIKICLAILICSFLVGCQSMLTPNHENECFQVQDALLYVMDLEKNDKVLLYNVCEQAIVNKKTLITDNTGHDIDTVEELEKWLGERPDMGAAIPGDTYGDSLGNIVIADIIYDGGWAREIIVSQIMERPIIGISWAQKDVVSDEQKEIAEVLLRNGGKIRFMLPVTNEEEAAETLEQIDGIIMTGGEDINPKQYGEEPYVYGANGWNDERDLSDILLVKSAIKMNVPMLAVCRGCQVFNVAMGGGLIQDIPTYLAGQVADGNIAVDRVTQLEGGSGSERVIVDEINHLAGGDYPYHAIVVDSASKWMYNIVQDKEIDWVSSWHHEAADPARLGEGITVAAYSADGIIEAIEYKENDFALGLQFHPEKDCLGDSRGIDVNQNICNAFMRELVNQSMK